MDPFFSLVPLAHSTDRLLMGPLAVSPFEMHPLKIANGLLTLNEMCNGRAQVAIGAGEGNLDAMDLKKPKKIVLAVREAIEIVMAAAHGNLSDGYDGEIFIQQRFIPEDELLHGFAECIVRYRVTADPLICPEVLKCKTDLGRAGDTG